MAGEPILEEAKEVLGTVEEDVQMMGDLADMGPGEIKDEEGGNE